MKIVIEQKSCNPATYKLVLGEGYYDAREGQVAPDSFDLTEKDLAAIFVAAKEKMQKLEEDSILREQALAALTPDQIRALGLPPRK